jgi:hypothetical protein
MVAAAVIGGAVIGAAGSSIAGGKAASATKSAAATSATVQREGLAQQERLSAPYRQAGEQALSQYQSLLGLKPGGVSPEQIIAQTPGYQFQFDQGKKAATNQASAMGLSLSGNQLTALTNYGQGQATGAYGDYANRLAGLSSMGQASAAGQAANVGATANNLSDISMQRGQSLANIGIGTTAGITGSIQGAINDYTTMNTLSALSNPGGGSGGMGGGYASEYGGMLS